MAKKQVAQKLVKQVKNVDNSSVKQSKDKIMKVMNGKKKSKKNNAVTTSEEDSEITLEDVLKLGGNKQDYELITSVDDDIEELEGKEDLDAEPIKKDEIKDLIKQLGFNDLMADDDSTEKKKKKEKKIKLAVAPESNEEKKSEKIVDSPAVVTKKDSPAVVTKKEAFIPKIPKTLTPRHYLLFKDGGNWMHQQFSEDALALEKSADSSLSISLKRDAEHLLDTEVELYKKQQEKKKKGNAGWIRTVMMSGTLSDKMAAYTLVVQDSPIHSLAILEKIVHMVDKKHKRECLMALDTLKDLFSTELLPDGTKLKSFDQHPLSEVDRLASGNRDSRDKRLMIWYYEDQLKRIYEDFTRRLGELLRDTVAVTKKKALAAALHLLCSKPEKEKELLAMIVNKLGDPDNKVAAQSTHLLSRLVEQHPNMKAVVVSEVERILYRPNIAAKAQYYGVCFLNQLILGHKESTLAAKLINIYFSFFKIYMKKGEVDSKMMGALLTGVNRAYPFAKVDKSKIEEMMDPLYKVVHIVNFNTSIQALMLLYQVTDASDSMSDRYYSALYRKLLDPGLQASPKLGMFLNLLFKSIKKDVVEKRIKAFIKRLLQVCCQMAPPFICGALILLSEISKIKQDVLVLAKMSEESDDEEEHFVDAPDPELDETNKMDKSSNDTDHKPADHEEEVNVVLSNKGHVTAASWIHRSNTGENRCKAVTYDGQHRNPLFCQAEHEVVVEITKLTTHYHPTVQMFATSILKGERIDYSGDPLEDFTNIRFLDRYVYRNPKKKEQGDEKRQDKFRHQNVGAVGVRAIPVTSKEYLAQGEENIPADEKFIYRQFSQLAAKKSENLPEDYDSDADSVKSEEFEDYILGNYEKSLDADDVDFNFTDEFSKKKDKGDGEDDSSDDDFPDEDDDLSDEEPEFGDDEEMRGLVMDEGDEADWEDGATDEDAASDISGEDDNEADDDDFDEEAIAFSDDEDDMEVSFKKPIKTKKAGKRSVQELDEDELDKLNFLSSSKAKKKKKDDDPLSLFAAAEEFAHLMDDNAGSKFDMGGSEAMANKDNASVKQLKWEADRDRWVHDRDWKSKKGRKGRPPPNKKKAKPGGPKRQKAGKKGKK